MSSLTLRTTLAVAGMAALGTAAAAPAFAAPALPHAPAPGAVTAPATRASTVTTPPSLGDLPDPFAFQMPNVHAGPETPTVDPELQTSSQHLGTDGALQQLDWSSPLGAAPSSDADQ